MRRKNRLIAPRLYPDKYREFATTTSWDEIADTAAELVCCPVFDERRDRILAGRPKGPLADAGKMLMFTYKKLFAVIRGESAMP